MRKFALIIGVAGSLITLGSWFVAAGDAQEDAIKKDRQEMQGSWRAASYELDGNQPLPQEQLQSVKATFDATGKVTIDADGTILLEATTKLDPTKKPKTIDITFTEGDMKGQTALGIYELTKDTFRYCRAAPGKDRPTEFASKPGSGLTLIVYKREQSK